VDTAFDEEAKARAGLRQNVLRYARQHPVTVRQIQHLGGFDKYAQAAVWTYTKRGQEILTHIGTMKNDCQTGRSVDVYCNGWQPKKDNLRHEVRGTDFCLLYPDATFRRGYHVGEFRPDVEMELNGQLYLIEIDCGSMTRPQVQRRWQKYRKVETGTVLIVAVSNPRRGIDSAERFQELVRWSESMYGIACFTTLERLQADPFGPVLWDAEEQRWRAFKSPSETP
jgi:hypothetical protein